MTRHAAAGTALPDAPVHGYTAGFKVAVGLYVLGIVVSLVTVTDRSGSARPMIDGRARTGQEEAFDDGRPGRARAGPRN